MMFTQKQIEALRAPLQRDNISSRSQSGRKLSYIEGWWAIHEANDIFGFDAWSRETVETKCVAERPRTIGDAKREGWGVSYIAKVRITVGEVTRDGTGAGHGIDVDLGLAHESAIKEAETDAMKRALMTFGNPFGLALYDKEQAEVDNGNAAGGKSYMGAPAQDRRGARPDGTMDTADRVVEVKSDNPVVPPATNVHTLALDPGEHLGQWTERYIAVLHKCQAAVDLAGLKDGNAVLLAKVLASKDAKAGPVQDALRKADAEARKRVGTLAEFRPASRPAATIVNPEAFVADILERLNQADTLKALELVWERDVEPFKDTIFPSDQAAMMAHYRLRYGTLGGHGE